MRGVCGKTGVLLYRDELDEELNYISVFYVHVFLFSFTLYPAHSGIGRGSVVFRYSAFHFPLNSGWYCVGGGTQHSVLLRHQSEEMKILNMYIYKISSSGNRTYICQVYSHTLKCALRHVCSISVQINIVFKYTCLHLATVDEKWKT